MVCVISLEEVNVSPETVPYSQCREVRTVSAAASNMDKITIAASAAICGTIVVAVLIFAAASRRRSRTVHRLHSQVTEKMPNPCCGGLTGTPSPSGPLSSLATIGAFGKQREWDQVSAYSARSIPRARSYTEPLPPEPLPGHPGRARSLADGQSQHSYAHSGRYGAPAYPGSLLGSRAGKLQCRSKTLNPTTLLLLFSGIGFCGNVKFTKILKLFLIFRSSSFTAVVGCGIRTSFPIVFKWSCRWGHRRHNRI